MTKAAADLSPGLDQPGRNMKERAQAEVNRVARTRSAGQSKKQKKHRMKNQPDERAKRPGREHLERCKANKSHKSGLGHPGEIKGRNKGGPPPLEHPGGCALQPETGTSGERGEQPRTGSSGTEPEGGAKSGDQLINSRSKNKTPRDGGSPAVGQEGGNTRKDDCQDKGVWERKSSSGKVSRAEQESKATPKDRSDRGEDQAP